MEENQICEVEGCNNKARYALYQILLDGRKRWLHVCKQHEGEIGSENMRRQVLDPTTGKPLRGGKGG